MTEFKGPFFIIGMPRSGTKLLRGLLSEHTQIGIPLYETEFFPYWAIHWQEFGDLSNYISFEKFYSRMIKLPYFLYSALDNRLINCKEWFGLCKVYTAAGVFEALLKHDIKYVSSKKNFLWGDKSPSYIAHLKLLKNHFPNAKFIHIVRDVRDYCISINNAWGKNMIRAAQRWVDNIQTARVSSKFFPMDYIEIRFEDLLDNTEAELKKICSFLSVQFEKDMLCLSKATENIGDAKGEEMIVKTNKNKYMQKMEPKLQEKIESIAGLILKSYNYPISLSFNEKRVSKNMMLFYKILDGFNLFKATLTRRGMIETLKHIHGSLIISKK